MGYLTTFTIYNDGIDLIKNDSDKFCEKLYRAAISGESKDFGHGFHANLVHVQKTRHADDHTMYVHMGNCLTQLNAYDKETEELMQRNPEFFEKLLAFSREEIKALEKKYKKIKESQNDPS